MVTRGLITDAIPRCYVRYDDGDVSPYQRGEIQQFLERGISVNLALNYDSTVAPGTTKMGTAHLWDLARIANEHGCKLTICSSGKTNFATLPTTYAALITELDKRNLENLLGMPVRAYDQDGTLATLNWCRGRRAMMKRALRETDHDWAFGLHKPQSLSLGFWSGGANLSNFFAPSNFSDPAYGLRPGTIRDPYSFPESGIDIGTCVVTRAGTEGSGAAAWLLGVDAGNKVNDWDMTWVYRYTYALAGGLCFWAIMHGEVRTDASQVGFAGGSQLAPGHFSARHVAWSIKALRDAGLLITCSMEEWAAHCYGDYAPGLELIQNPKCRLPYKVIGDLSAGDFLFPAGMTSGMAGSSAFSVSQGMLNSGPADANSNAKYDDVVGQRIDEVAGTQVVAAYNIGGGLKLVPGGAGVYNNCDFTFGGLPPGNYLFSCLVSGVGANVLNRRGIAVVAHRNLIPVEPNFDSPNPPSGGANPDSASTPEVSVVRAETGADYTLNYGAAVPTKFELHLHCPRDPIPTVQASAAVNPGEIAGGASTTIDVSITGARRTARVRWLTSVPMEAGLENSCAVITDGSARITITNTTGGPLTPASKTYWLWVDKLVPESLLAAGGAPLPWTYSLAVLLTNYTTELVITDPQLVYLGA